ncbi:MAG: hypothetical protein LBF81_02760 [Prevotellaceae bacterium]|jgi:hypothetical protein|nr:hypothetical protein [Prevotellaceae bacterium]
MKKIIFLFALLASIAASAAVKVTPLDVNYNTKTVTFSVSWTSNAANNRVWVWVDLCPVAGTSPGTFAKAVISSPSVTAGSIAEFNQRGFYVNANPTTVTATLDNATGTFNWCVYGSDFPPNAKDNGSGGYDLRGSPPFIINGTIEWTANTYSGSEITALTDATGCPGVWCGRDDEAAGLLDCCATGTTKCSSTCKKNGTYETYDGGCTGACNTAYVQLRNQCGEVENQTYGTYTDTSCSDGCGPQYDMYCNSRCDAAHTLVEIYRAEGHYERNQRCIAFCKDYPRYNADEPYHQPNQYYCYCCN